MYNIQKSNKNTDTITAPVVQILWYLKCWFPYFVLISPIPSTFYRQSRWGIFIYFFLLSQIRMSQPDYPRPRRCNIGTTHMIDYSVRGCVPYFVSLATAFQAYHTNSLFLFQNKTSLHSRIFFAVLVFSDVTSTKIHPIVLHVKWVWLVHIHLHQVPFSLSRPWIHVLIENSLSFDILMSL